MSTQLALGKELTRDGKTYLIVGIADSSWLFESGDGTWEKLDEKYVQLKTADGEIEFLTLTEDVNPFLEKHSTIKALPRQPWRKK